MARWSFVTLLDILVSVYEYCPRWLWIVLDIKCTHILWYSCCPGYKSYYIGTFRLRKCGRTASTVIMSTSHVIPHLMSHLTYILRICTCRPPSTSQHFRSLFLVVPSLCYMFGQVNLVTRRLISMFSLHIHGLLWLSCKIAVCIATCGPRVQCLEEMAYPDLTRYTLLHGTALQVDRVYPEEWVLWLVSCAWLHINIIWQSATLHPTNSQNNHNHTIYRYGQTNLPTPASLHAPCGHFALCYTVDGYRILPYVIL